MKILLLTPSAPSPQQFDGCPRHFSFASELKKKGHDVYLLTQGEIPNKYENYYENVFSKIFFLDKIPLKAEKISGRFFHTLSLSSSLDLKHRFPYFLKKQKLKTKEVIEEIKPDALLAKTIDVEQFIPLDFEHCLIDMVDSIALLSKRISKDSSSLKVKLESNRKYFETLKLEKNILKRRKHCLCISEVDKDFLKENTGLAPSYVLPNGINEDSLITNARFLELEEKREQSIVFSGAMGYFPNSQAAKYLANEVFPKVVEKLPNAKLVLVGKGGKETLPDFSNTENIEVTGFVDSISPYLETGGVYASTLLSGAGLKNKILSAFSSGIPVVATQLSVDGIDVKKGEDILLAETGEELAKQICYLLENKEAAKEQALKALNLVKEKYRWEKISNSLETILKNISSS